MPRPRSQLISIEDTPYYHLVSRCVRRTFLCGVDKDSGKSYEHRRQWIENRIRLVSSLFGIDMCSYAVMSNHLHIVCKLCPDEIVSLSDKQVVSRWTCLFKGSLFVQKWQQGIDLMDIEQALVDQDILEYRERLTSISWFMKCVNEPIARQANKEDDCTGHFWESRFKSQALLTEEAILSCMSYVDLNPIRAQMATTPEKSEHTSIKERLKPQFNLEQAVQEQIQRGALRHFNQKLKPLAKFEENISHKEQKRVLFSLKDYLELVDFTGRCILPNKRGAIPLHTPPILKRLCLESTTWIENTTQFEKLYRSRFLYQAAIREKTG